MEASVPEPQPYASSGRMSLGERLRARREERRISQSQAARELAVARTAYRLWELGAARPSPDRWRLVARWLGVSTSALLLAEGLISEGEYRDNDAAAERYETATGESADAASERQSGDFFRQAQSFIDQSIQDGLLTSDEASQFSEMFERIRARLGQMPSD